MRSEIMRSLRYCEKVMLLMIAMLEIWMQAQQESQQAATTK